MWSHVSWMVIDLDACRWCHKESSIQKWAFLLRRSLISFTFSSVSSCDKVGEVFVLDPWLRISLRRPSRQESTRSGDCELVERLDGDSYYLSLGRWFWLRATLSYTYSLSRGTSSAPREVSVSPFSIDATFPNIPVSESSHDFRRDLRLNVKTNLSASDFLGYLPFH